MLINIIWAKNIDCKKCSKVYKNKILMNLYLKTNSLCHFYRTLAGRSNPSGSGYYGEDGKWIRV